MSCCVYNHALSILDITQTQRQTDRQTGLTKVSSSPQVRSRDGASRKEGPQVVKTEDQDVAISRDGAPHEEGPQVVKTQDQDVAISQSVGPSAPAFEDVMTTYKGEIIGAFATITQTCPQHHTLFTVNPGLKNTLCAPCEMHYKNTKFSITCEAIITVELSDSSKKVWRFADSCFAKVVPPRLWTTKEDVIQHLLDLNMADFKVRNNEIVSCSPCPITTVTTAL